MRCLILDDEPMAIDILLRYVERVPALALSGSFRDPVAALAFLQNNPVDLLFLDIDMPGLSGMQLLTALEKPPLVIFITAYPDYAVQSYEFEAVDYLLKPVTFGRFEKAVAKSLKVFQAAQKGASPAPHPAEVATLKSGAQTHRVKIADILFLKKEGNYFTVFTQEKKIVIRQNMETALQWLPSGQFRRVHRSYIVALRHVTVVGKHSVRVGEHTIPVSAAYGEWLNRE